MDEFAKLAIWYCHQAIDPILQNRESVEFNNNAILELSLKVASSEYNGYELSKKMLLIGFNRVHCVNIDVPYLAIDDYSGIEPLIVMEGIEYYKGWEELLEQTIPIFDEFHKVYDSDKTIQEFLKLDRKTLDAMGIKRTHEEVLKIEGISRDSDRPVSHYQSSNLWQAPEKPKNRISQIFRWLNGS